MVCWTKVSDEFVFTGFRFSSFWQEEITAIENITAANAIIILFKVFIINFCIIEILEYSFSSKKVKQNLIPDKNAFSAIMVFNVSNWRVFYWKKEERNKKK